MSWLDKVDTDMVILCGGEISEDNNGTLIVDDKVKAFKPLWIKSTYLKPYIIAEFNFKKIAGSLVKRGAPKARQYRLEICFTGPDHLETARDFDVRSGYFNPATGMAPPWKITHPLYGSMFVQPTETEFDDTQYDCTYIRGIVLETIKDNGKAYQKEDAVSTVTTQAAKVNASFTQTYVAEVPKPDVYDLQGIRNHINTCYKAVSGMLSGYQDDANAYLKYYNDANALANTAVFDTDALLWQTQQMLGAPAYFIDSVVNRLNMFAAQATILNRDVAAILALKNRPTAALKRLYENNAGTLILGMCLSTMLNVTDDYQYRPQLLRVIGTLITQYNNYLNNLNLLQSITGALLGGFIPNPTPITGLHQVVMQTVNTLFNLSAGAKQQKSIILNYDDNLILLAHRLYGRADETTINTLITNNNIGLNELLRIKAGRQIIYYN